jgi:hypothetical protein
MSTLYTFGCSFTEEFKEFMDYSPLNMSNGRVKYVADYHNGIPPDGWVTMLSNKLGYELKNFSAVNGFKNNYGDEGNCNFSIFNNVCYASERFKKDDIVIIEWTMMDRFKWYDDEVKNIRTILPNLLCTKDPDTIKTLENILVNRVNLPWIDELFVHQKIINRLSESIGFNLFYWTIDKSIVKYKYDDIINDKRYLINKNLKKNEGYINLFWNNGARTITEETNGIINDGHFGISGHKVISDLFYEYILRNI